MDQARAYALADHQSYSVMALDVLKKPDFAKKNTVDSLVLLDGGTCDHVRKPEIDTESVSAVGVKVSIWGTGISAGGVEIANLCGFADLCSTSCGRIDSADGGIANASTRNDGDASIGFGVEVDVTAETPMSH